ncbi:MAG: metallophosphoesterase family protein [Actinomycetota bacterium]
MRIAVVSDIHGNLLALDAVMTDLESQNPDQIWCGGDIGWGGSWASECIKRVRDAGWTTVKGNTDVWITGDPQTVDTEEERDLLNKLAAIHDISKEDAYWLANLPLGFTPAGSILLVHGTPQSPFSAPMPDAPASEFSVYEDRAKVVVYGHVHHAFVRRLAGGTIVANTGSVGFPQDGDTASYLIIDRHGPEISLRHRRVPFDRRAVIAEARRTPEPLGSRILANLNEV